MGQDDLYELADEAPAKAVHAAPAKAGAGADVPQRVLPIRPLGYKNPAAIGTSAPERVFADPVKDLYLPLALIGGGLVIEAVALWIQSNPGQPFLREVQSEGIRLCITTVLMLIESMDAMARLE